MKERQSGQRARHVDERRIIMPLATHEGCKRGITAREGCVEYGRIVED